MSETEAPVPQFSLARRILRTPFPDLLRGRLIPPTGPVDVHSILATSNLPTPATDLITRVTRRTRLWASEQIDVATELVSHFAEGLDAGTPLDDLLARFGDERRVARLIRRAKRRNRPLPWQAWRVLCRGFVVLCLLYALLAAYYFAGRPAPSVDYVAAINKPILAIPEAQRAWPLYRQAIRDLHLATPSANDRQTEELQQLLDAQPGSKRWPALVAWLDAHRADLNVIHRAAARPHLGFVLGPGGSADIPSAFPNSANPTAGTPMSDVVMPALMPLRKLAVVLSADATAATEAGDRARFLRDTGSLLRLADHVREHPSLIAQLFSVGMRSLACDTISRTVASPHVTMLTDDDLRDLAHRLAGPRNASDLFDLRFERLSFHDLIQRTYTAGGPGGGHLTPEGLRHILDPITGTSAGAAAPPRAPVISMAVQPASLLLTPTRDEVLNRYDHLLDQAEALLHEPVRDADWASWDAQSAQTRTSVVAWIRNYPIGLQLVPLGQVAITAERCLAFRDGLLCGIALETYRRHHDGAFPPTLDALVPGVLPAVPADRVTGDPFRYTLKSGHPVVYSVGVDRTDDGGTSPVERADNGSGWDAGLGSPAKIHGDWVLYPRPEDSSQDED